MKLRQTILIIFSIALAGISSVEAQGLQTDFDQETDTGTTSFIITDVMIPLEDGTRLHGRLYRPDTDKAAYPTIYTLTPYTVDQFGHRYGSYFARRGFTYLNVDVRGRGASEGDFSPMFEDGTDGIEVAKWITRQPWNDGHVATRGASYHGMLQWKMLGEGAGPVQTSVTTASIYPGWDIIIPGGIYRNYAVRWLYLVAGKSFQTFLFSDGNYWKQRYRKMHQSGKAYSNFGDITGLSLRTKETFEQWIKHPHFDEFWRSATPDSVDYKKIDIPLLSITGHFDGNQKGTLRYYKRHMKHGKDRAKQEHFLLIGPWNHSGTYNPQKELAGLTFADTAAIDMNTLHLQWFNWILRDSEKPEMLTDGVVYYVMGAGQWRSASSLSTVADTARTLYISSPDGNPDNPFNAGNLIGEQPTKEDIDQYVYDPRNTAGETPSDHFEGDRNYTTPGAAFMKGPKLIYHSKPAEDSFEMSGNIRLDAWIELDVPDTDLAAWVYEIRPNGETIYLGKSLLRARHRKGVEMARLIEPGTINRYRFDRFNWTSRQIKEGSRIRLVIAPLNDIHWQKNYNSAKPVMGQTIEDAQTATVKLHMSPDHPSKLVLPVRTK